MRVMIAGGERAVRLLLSGAHETEIEVSTIVERAPSEASVAALSARLRDLEHGLTVEPPDAVLLADDTDTALAAVLVASKLGVRVAVAAGAGSSSVPGRLIAQLADRRVRGGPAALGDWARSHTRL